MRKTLIIALAGVILSGAIVAQKRDPEPVRLPQASGKFSVGTTVMYWTDNQREEKWSKNAGEGRRLAVQIWYPAENTGAAVAPYIFGLEDIRSSIEEYWGGIPNVETEAYMDAPIAEGSAKFPVLVFSHGMNSGRFVYTTILRDLASRGFVVAAIDHSYWGPGVAFRDGKSLQFQDGMIALDKLTSDEIDSMMRDGINVMAADQQFVIGQMGLLNESDPLFRNRLDLSSAGSIGHSMGGMAAMEATLTYSAFKVCVSLDGVNYFLDKRPKPSQKPLMLLLNSQWGRNAPEKIATRYLQAWSDPVVGIVIGAKHNYFSDIPLIEPPDDLTGLMEPRKSYSVISSYVISFLELHLKKKGNGRTDAPEEIEVVDLASFKN